MVNLEQIVKKAGINSNKVVDAMQHMVLQNPNISTSYLDTILSHSDIITSGVDNITDDVFIDYISSIISDDKTIKKWTKFGNDDPEEFNDYLDQKVENLNLRNELNDAYIDPMTGAFTRVYFDNKFQPNATEFIKQDEHAYFIHADANGLKTINDTFGHEVGDKYLEIVGKVMGETLQNILRTETGISGPYSEKRDYSTESPDKVFRMGGDEFLGVLVGKKLTQEVALKVGERVSDILNYEIDTQTKAYIKSIGRDPAEISDKIENFSVAVGMIQHHHKDGAEIKDSYKAADKFCYMAKVASKQADGHNGLYFVDSEFDKDKGIMLPFDKKSQLPINRFGLESITANYQPMSMMYESDFNIDNAAKDLNVRHKKYASTHESA